MTERPRASRRHRPSGASRRYALAPLVLFGLVAPALAVPGAAHAAPVAHHPHDQLAPLAPAEAWEHSTGQGVTVAVLDSGVDAEHPDLADRVLPGRDFVDESTDGRVDPVGHGTTVASLVAGNGEPAIGLAPDATILPVRVLDEQNRYQSAATVADGVIWAVDEGADVINLSLGGANDSSVLSDALTYAMSNDVVVIACTGNATGDYTEVWYPAREPGVVAVSGLTSGEGEVTGWPQSLIGPETVLAAPAVLTGAETGGGHREVQGTSFSSALVAATAALVRADQPELSAADVVNRLVATAEDLGEPGRDPVYGFGAIDPVAALTGELPPVARNPLDTKSRQRVSGLGAAPNTPQPAGSPDSDDEAMRRVIGAPDGGAALEPEQRGGSSWPAWALLTALFLVLLAGAARRARTKH